MLAACDQQPTAIPPEGNEPADRPSPLEASEPLLAQAPWFELPADWGEQHPVLSPNAKLDAHLTVLAEAQIEPNPADGAGHAWIESVTPIDEREPGGGWRRDDAGDRSDRPQVPAASRQRIAIGFEVGPLGIEQGGLLFAEPEPFWSWSPAQTSDPDGDGFTTARARAGDVTLVPSAPGAAFQVSGRALAPGERLDFVYGAGPRGSRVDLYAERGSEILIGVDADGDGARAWLPESILLDVLAREGIGIVAHGPADVAPGESIAITVAILDSVGNRARWPDRGDDDGAQRPTALRVETLAESTAALASPPGPVAPEAGRDAPLVISLGPAAGEGTLRLRIAGEGSLAGFSASVPPIVVRRASTRLVWGDLHGHSGLSDGTGTPEDYFAYARDVARLDVTALTDHDHWGMRALVSRPDRIERILTTAERFHEPGRFVTIPGYEWTSWLHGHRHVLYFEGEAPVFSAFDPETDRPDELWNALRGRSALTLAHHPAGEPIATNWLFAPDPELEPLAEIASVHGMGEAEDAPAPVSGGIPGFFVRDVLMSGVRLGFVGSGDSHDGHPGLAQIAAGQSGLAGLFTESLDRPGLLAAMKRRRTFATNGIRPFLRVTLGDVEMGSTFTVAPDSEPTAEASERAGRSERAQVDDAQRLHIRYEATAPVERIDLIRSGRIATLPGEGRLSLDIERAIPRLAPGEFHYVRIIESKGGVAWSSPIFARGARPAAP